MIASDVATNPEPGMFGLGPIPAVKQALQRAGWEIRSLERVEINEAFSAIAIVAYVFFRWVMLLDMLAELRDDNKELTARLREEHGDVATASLVENWIDEAERRTWFLFESGRSAEGG